MRIKVAQCWDDGVATDIRLVEILRKYNAKATFNLCPGFMSEETIRCGWANPVGRNWSINNFVRGQVGKKDLKAVYDGFQVASHCREHEDATKNSPEIFLKAAMDARNFLEDTFQRECRGFAWPNGRHTPETEQMLAEAGFRYGRTTENTEEVTRCSNPLALASNCHFLNRNFWKIFEKARKSGVFYFWGHSYEMMDCPQIWANFELAIRTLSEDPEVEWVDVIDLVPLLH